MRWFVFGLAALVAALIGSAAAMGAPLPHPVMRSSCAVGGDLRLHCDHSLGLNWSPVVREPGQ